MAFVGIGENGHLAFNDPPADFETEEPYLVVELDEACRRQQLGEGWFATLDDVPRRAISMSIRQILKAREILCIVPDARKAKAVRDCLEGEVTPVHPSSILQTHPATTVYLDRDSAALLKRGRGSRDDRRPNSRRGCSAPLAGRPRRPRALLRGEAKPAARHDIPYSTEVVTPHVPWATTLPGGPIRGFFVPPVTEGRDMVELMQRLSLEPTTVTIDRSWDVNCWGIGDFYDGDHVLRGDKDDFRIVYGYVEEELTSAKPFEVLVIPGLNGWSRYTRKTRDAILRRVSEGAGLVLLHPFVGDVKGHPFLGDEKEGDERIWEISPLVGVPDDRVSDRGYPELNREAIVEGEWRARPHPITEGLDLSLLPSGARGGRFYRYQARGDVVVEAAGLPVIATRTYGKGRVVAFATVGDGLVPEAVDPVKTRTYWDYWEYQHSLLARAVLWAAREKGDLSIRKLEATPESGLTLVLAGPRARTVEVESRARGPNGTVLASLSRPLALVDGESRLEIPASDLAPAGWPGGRSVVDVIVRDPATGATLQWGWAGLEAPKAASLSGLRPNATVYREGDTMSLVARAAGDLAGLAVRVRFADDLGRLRAVEEAPARGERTFFHRLDHALGKRVIVSAELADAKGRVVDTLRHEPIVVAARERRQQDYRGLLSFETPVHYFAERRLRRLRERAMDTSFTWGGEVNDELHMPRGWFGVYWYDRGPTTPEGLEQAIAEFGKTGDVDSLALPREEGALPAHRRAALPRPQPELRRPGRAAAAVRPRAHLRARQGRLQHGLLLRGRRGLARVLRRRGGLLLGTAHPRRLPGVAARAVRLARRAQPLVGECLPRLGRRRAAHHRGGAARGPLRAVGGPPHVHGGLLRPCVPDGARRRARGRPRGPHRSLRHAGHEPLERLRLAPARRGDRRLPVVLRREPVGHPPLVREAGRTDRLLDRLRAQRRRGEARGVDGGPAGRPAPAAVLEPLDRQPGHDLLALGPRPRRGLPGPALRGDRPAADGGGAPRRRGRRPLLDALRPRRGHPRPPRPRGGEAGGTSFPANRDGWVSVLDDLGLSFRFVAAPQVEAGALQGKRVFVLPYSAALSDREVAAIRRFVEEGGVLLADGAAGLFDEHVAWRETGALDALFGVTAPPRGRAEGAGRGSTAPSA